MDTSAWFRFVMPGDSRSAAQAHAAVCAAFEAQSEAGVRLVTTNLVVAETHQLLVLRADRRRARRFLDLLRGIGVMLVRPGEEQEHAALSQWIDQYEDQDFSLTDAVSFAVMRERRITRALALDRHFTVAGFEVLPHLPPGVREAIVTPTTES